MSALVQLGTTSAGFFGSLATRCLEINSLLCVGLDPHIAQLANQTAKGALDFCTRLIDATTHVAAAYKPNVAFFEAFGAEGIAVLKEVIQYVPKEIPVLLDAKRGDIGTTAEAYAAAAYQELGASSITVNAYMGVDTVLPFIEDSSKGVFVLCKTSNPSSNELQTLTIRTSNRTFYEEVAVLANSWNKKNNVGLVVGATDAEALAKVRRAAPNLWILAPGIGAQGGDLDQACAAGLDGQGLGLLIPISRGISKADDPRKAAEEFRDAINLARERARQCLEERERRRSVSLASGLLAYQKDFIKFALSSQVLQFGSFTLKSGRQSPYFFNAGLFCTGQALSRLGSAYAEAITRAGDRLTFDTIFGPAYKGISLGAVVALRLAESQGLDVGFAYNRKEAKDHGEGGLLAGCDLKGKRVLIIDDVITAGTAIRQAIDILTDAGAVPAGVVLALDRQEVGADPSKGSAVQQVEAEFNIPVVCVIGLHNIADYLEEDQDPEVLEALQAYRKQYGI